MTDDFQDPAPVVAWQRFSTILLDMDGTVLDLAFDNYFWRELVPEVYAGQQNISTDEARKVIYDLYSGREGTLEWYCLEFWTEQLKLDLLALKHNTRDRIRYLPGAQEFLREVSGSGKRLVLVTNAHQDTLALKKTVAGLDEWFSEFVSSHDLGLPKEHPEFWHRLEALLGFDPATTLFIDDSVPVLDAAAGHGLSGVVAIRHPDSGQPAREPAGHPMIDGVGELVSRATPTK